MKNNGRVKPLYPHTVQKSERLFWSLSASCLVCCSFIGLPVQTPHTPPAKISFLVWRSELENTNSCLRHYEAVNNVCREFFSSKYAEVEEKVFSKAPEVFASEAFTPEKFMWAAAVLRAKVHPPLDGGSLALVPLADKVGFAPNMAPGLPSGFTQASLSSTTRYFKACCRFPALL